MYSPIQLTDHKVLRLHFDTHVINGQAGELEFSHSLQIHQATEQENLWLVRLDVFFKSIDEDAPSPYAGEIAVVGTFALKQDFPEEKTHDMVYMNGGGILYGMVREIVVNLSSRAVHGSLLMPTLDARCFIPESQQSIAEDRKGSEPL